MEFHELSEQVLAAWRRHNEILLHLLDQVPRGGLEAVPAGSKGRDVSRQFFHLSRVRTGWVKYHRTGRREKLPRRDQGKGPIKAELKKGLRDSGLEVERFLAEAVKGEAKPRLFGQQALRWMGYLIAHESHHRGQIMLALKQSGFRMPEKVAVQGLWGKWIFGK